jgi:hypothetical protein
MPPSTATWRGRAHLVFEPDGGGTLATAAWTIEMMQLPMRVAARFAHPLLRWGHTTGL